MIPLPTILGGEKLYFWRLTREERASDWDSGEGAFQLGGRWNSRGKRCIYCSLDSSTAILEMAVHKSFATLNSVPHVLSGAVMNDPDDIKIIKPVDVPNPYWLIPGAVSASQQRFGDHLLSKYKFVIVPSAVSMYSWNLIFDRQCCSGKYELKIQERLSFDPRLDPP